MSDNQPAATPPPNVCELPAHSTPAPNPAKSPSPPPLEPQKTPKTPETPRKPDAEYPDSPGAPVSPNFEPYPGPVLQPECSQPAYTQPYYQPIPPAGFMLPPQGYQPQYPPPPGQTPPLQMPYQYPQPQYNQQKYDTPYQLQPVFQAPPAPVYNMPAFPSDTTIDPNWEPPVGINFTPAPSMPTSEGYVPGVEAEDYNSLHDAELIYKSLKGTIADPEPLIHVVPYLSPLQLETIRNEVYRDYGVHLTDLVEKLFPSSFKDGLRAILYGPLDFDAWLLNRAMEGIGVKTYYLDLVLLGRKNGDIEAIKTSYQLKFKRHLVSDVRKELSGDVEALFMNALDSRRMDEADPIDEEAIQNDIMRLCEAMVGDTEANMVSEIFVTRSDKQLERIIEGYENSFPGKTLEEVIKKKFRGHMEDALLYILQGVQNRALRDARLLEGTMKGLGTKDEELMYRAVKMHWDKEHLKEVKNAYSREYPKKISLSKRVKDETSGNQQKLLLELLGIA